MKTYHCAYSNRLLVWRELRKRTEQATEPQPSGLRAWLMMLVTSWTR